MTSRQPTPFGAPRGRSAGALRPWSHRLAWVLCAATVVLLAAGALVTGTGSSLAVPDWPLAYGQLFPPMVGGILYEHGHRLIAAGVGLLSMATAAWLWWAEPRGWVRWLGLGALAAVIVQGLLGGITVLLLLPQAVSVSHALLAQLFFLMTVALVQVTAPGWREGWPGAGGAEAVAGSRRVTALGAVTLAALGVELLLGAVVRHSNAGLAIPDFPLAYGGLVPPLSGFPIVIHFLHRLGALAVVALAAALAWQALRRGGPSPALRAPALAMVLLLALQVVLGGWVVWSLRAPAITTAHLVNGSLLTASVLVLVLRGGRLSAG